MVRGAVVARRGGRGPDPTRPVAVARTHPRNLVNDLVDNLVGVHGRDRWLHWRRIGRRARPPGPLRWPRRPWRGLGLRQRGGSRRRRRVVAVWARLGVPDDRHRAPRRTGLRAGGGVRGPDLWRMRGRVRGDRRRGRLTGTRDHVRRGHRVGSQPHTRQVRHPNGQGGPGQHAQHGQQVNGPRRHQHHLPHRAPTDSAPLWAVPRPGPAKPPRRARVLEHPRDPRRHGSNLRPGAVTNAWPKSSPSPWSHHRGRESTSSSAGPPFGHPASGDVLGTLGRHRDAVHASQISAVSSISAISAVAAASAAGVRAPPQSVGARSARGTASRR
jgi:hypothetical protein